ncbi:uncharacterized protein BO80DRAFT_450005 [Aspergillus ibericus CBS 121593]|uniref:Uncharacterized protein n=1 Tax=Aspergillus ibericus CBS 121593 TaxID=1448316 RepID=A0A395GJY5_9EURO|nr:hypothetical protein BO80DRAFT_450005 [Aspergillus ibericus CBS 121593]RAK95694.1 hypothetical protein BO80DRAFT_450005 [Aspergillus ibericus CBS 121593]
MQIGRNFTKVLFSMRVFQSLTYTFPTSFILTVGLGFVILAVIMCALFRNVPSSQPVAAPLDSDPWTAPSQPTGPNSPNSKRKLRKRRKLSVFN